MDVPIQRELGFFNNYQFIILVIGNNLLLGNLLTLFAIPYVRRVYGAQFSILQLNSVVLILHLSLAELLITIVMIPTGWYFTIEELGLELNLP